MNLAIISFTNNGNHLNQIIATRLKQLGHHCRGYQLAKFSQPEPNHMLDHSSLSSEKLLELLPVTEPVSVWTRNQFGQQDGLVFIGAAGIAVRLIAPYLQHKSVDPAVVVIDDGGQFVISLLSGHVGGANSLATLIAAQIDAIPVITTATDVNNKFAVDIFAQKNQLMISDWSMMKYISADLLADRAVGFESDLPVLGELPAGLIRHVNEKSASSMGKSQRFSHKIWITYQDYLGDDPMILRLTPKVIVLGIGCQKGVDAVLIEELVMKTLSNFNINLASVKAIASIDLKKNEPGLLEFASNNQLPCYFYPAAVLQQVAGTFSDSVFVQQVTGVGNVCERAALHHAQTESTKSKLLIRKQSDHGVTVAVAIEYKQMMI